MNNLLSAGLSNAAVCLLLALLVYAITRVWKNPRGAHVLWLLVLIKLLTPPLWHAPLPAIDWPQAESAAVADVPQNNDALSALPIEAPIATGADVEFPLQMDSAIASTTDLLTAKQAEPLQELALDMAPESNPNQGELRIAQPIHEFVEAALAARDSQDRQPVAAPAAVVTMESAISDSPISATQIVLSLWLAGSAIWFLVFVSRIRVFGKQLARTSRRDVELEQVASDLARRLGLRSCPKIWVVDASIAPLVWRTWVRPVVVLPVRLLDELTPQQLETVIAHELTHIRRGDHWTRLIEMLVICLYWWNPTVWWVRRQLHVVEEACCDSEVLRLFPQQSVSYAEALLQTADFIRTQRAATTFAASGLSGIHQFKERVEMILSNRFETKLSWTARCFIVAFAALLPLSARVAGEQPETPATAVVAQPAEVADVPDVAEPANTADQTSVIDASDAVESTPTMEPTPAVAPVAETSPEAETPATAPAVETSPVTPAANVKGIFESVPFSLKRSDIPVDFKFDIPLNPRYPRPYEEIGFPGDSYGPHWELIRLATLKSAWPELKVTPEQSPQLHVVGRFLMSKEARWKQYSPERDADLLDTEYELVGYILTDEQKQILEQIIFRRRGLTVLWQPDVQEQLDLTKEQVDTIRHAHDKAHQSTEERRKIDERLIEKVKELAKTADHHQTILHTLPSMVRQETEAIAQKEYDGVWDIAFKTLNDDQRKKLVELRGSPIVEAPRAIFAPHTLKLIGGIFADKRNQTVDPFAPATVDPVAPAKVDPFAPGAVETPSTQVPTEHPFYKPTKESVPLDNVAVDGHATESVPIDDINANDIADGSVPLTNVPSVDSDNLLASQPREWGTLTGRFVYDGTPPEPERRKFAYPGPLPRDADEATLKSLPQIEVTDESLIVGPRRGVANIIVYAISPDMPIHPDYQNTVDEPVYLDIENARFVPRALGVWTAQSLIVRNKDSELNNFHLQPSSNSQPSNVALPSKDGQFQPQLKQERYPCGFSSDIYPWMKGLLVIRDNPYFAVTGDDGNFRIENLPEGEWEFVAFHEKFGGINIPRNRERMIKLKIGPGATDVGTIKLSPETFEPKLPSFQGHIQKKTE